MKGYRPLLIENLGISLPGIDVLRLQLNEHLQGSGLGSHSHRYGQLLVYLRGQGAQCVGGRRYEARSGTVIYAAPGEQHSFEQERERNPLCLVMDISLKSGLEDSQPGSVGMLPASALNHLRSRMSQLFAMRDIGKSDRQLSVGAIILDVLDVLLRAIGRLDPRASANVGSRSLTRSAERAILSFLSDPSADLAFLADRLGYQRDYLNRRLKSECGLTLGQLRARVRLREAQRFLCLGISVGEVASKVGIDDQNYFARWFRMQAGVSPSDWRADSTR
ncbi:MAG: AraC family transcriptional regulator [Verrucomicrobiaceae bacterium]|nr:AraC family transcriptional regulator [Verrucomicrobiaceae bacterium]